MFVKQAASASVRSYETESWRRGLTNKGATRFLKVHTTLQPHVVYEIVRDHMNYRRSLTNIIKLLAFPQECEECVCSESGVAYTDTVKHYVMNCESLLEIRSEMWNTLLDTVSCNQEAMIIRMSDNEQLELLLTGQSNIFKDTEVHTIFIVKVAKSIKNLMYVL